MVKVQADIERAQRDLDKVKSSVHTIGTEAGIAGTKMQSAGTMMVAALKSVKIYAIAAAAALGAVGYKAVTAAGDAEEIRNKFEAVFKDTSDAAEEWANDFSDTVGRSTIETLGYLSKFQDTFVPLGFDREEAADLSEQLVQLSVDLASFNNEQDTDAIASLQSAIVGNHETMRRYGVIITQTSLNQELLNMGIEGGINKATEMEKVQARLNIIMSSTTDAQGDAARTADSYANQLRTLKGNISDVMTEAGKDAMDDLTNTLIEFNEWGTSGGYDQMAEGIADVANAFATVARYGAEATKALTSFYTFATSQKMEVPEGMKLTEFESFLDSFTQGMEPEFDWSGPYAVDSYVESLAQGIQNYKTQLEKENDNTTPPPSGDEGDDTDTKDQELIPGWAGKRKNEYFATTVYSGEDYFTRKNGVRGESLADYFVNGPTTVESPQIVQPTVPVSQTSGTAGTKDSFSVLKDILQESKQFREALYNEPRKVDADIEIKNYFDLKDLAKKVAEILQRDMTYTPSG